MNQPVPDMQAAQGIYASNIERLEQHAEKLSFTSDLAKELRRLNNNQKRHEGSNANTSIPPVFPLRLGANDHQLRSLNGDIHIKEISTANELSQDGNAATFGVTRSISITSRSTTERAEEVFSRFDGTHTQEDELWNQRDAVDASIRTVDQNIDTERSRPDPSKLLFYPAPIPMVLSLPPRLSNKQFTGKENSHAAQEDSGSWSRDSRPGFVPSENIQLSQQLSSNPTLQRLNGSASGTLESLLDASVHASVGAFTEHPITRSSRTEAYRSSGIPMTENDSGATKPHAPSFSTQLPLSSEQAEEQAEIHPGERTIDYDNLRPVTLLDELDARKKRQHSRNKSAADNFPHGLHASLLQLDQVAQLQQQNRKTRPTTLTWERDTRIEEADIHHENVPVALLTRSQHGNMTADSLVGLQEQRHFDDNEPLSTRRVRLKGTRTTDARGADISKDRNSFQRSLDENHDSEPAETLAQRKRRLRIEDAIPIGKTVTGELTSELLGVFGEPIRQPAAATNTKADAIPPSEDNETLAQRRKRLQGASSASRR